MVSNPYTGIFYPFHQSTTMLYLTGFNEPDACLAIEKVSGIVKTTMFVQPNDPSNEKWDGPRMGLDQSKIELEVDDSRAISSFEDFMRKRLSQSGISNIFADIDVSEKNEGLLHGTFIQTRSGSAVHQSSADSSITKFAKFFNPRPIPTLQKLSPLIDQLRITKSSEELQQMRRSGQIAGRSFQEAMRAVKPGMTEHQLYAVIDYNCRMQGASCLSYVPVVAGGKNALILHYVLNKDVLRFLVVNLVTVIWFWLMREL